MHVSNRSQDRITRFLETLPSKVSQETLRLARMYAGDEFVCVLLTGPIGAGKTQLFNYIHTRSPRREHPHHYVSLGSMSEPMARSELFGHVRGAYTDARDARLGAFRSAGSGTVSLDEIAKCPLAVQAQLIPAFDPGVFSPLGSDDLLRRECRILAATNTDLQPLVDRGEFLDDLRSRLVGYEVHLPPLSERREDIPHWAMFILENECRLRGHVAALPTFDPDLMQAIKTAPLQCNLRELSQIVTHLLVVSQGARALTPAHCIGRYAYLATGTRRLGEFSLAELETLLASNDHRVSRVADQIGAHRASLHKQLKRLRTSKELRA